MLLVTCLAEKTHLKDDGRVRSGKGSGVGEAVGRHDYKALYRSYHATGDLIY